MSDIAEKLANAAGGGGSKRDAVKIREFAGQTLTVVSIKKVTGGRFGESIIATGFNAAGEEVDVWTTSVSGRQLEAVESELPQDFKVISFPTDYGNTGIRLELA